MILMSCQGFQFIFEELFWCPGQRPGQWFKRFCCCCQHHCFGLGGSQQKKCIRRMSCPYLWKGTHLSFPFSCSVFAFLAEKIKREKKKKRKFAFYNSFTKEITASLARRRKAGERIGRLFCDAFCSNY